VIEALKKQGLSPIAKEQGDSLGKEMHLSGYVECSALTQKGLKQVFDEASRVVVGKGTNSTGAGAGSKDQKKKSNNKKQGCTLI